MADRSAFPCRSTRAGQCRRTEPVRTVLPSGPKATARTQCWWRKGRPIGFAGFAVPQARSSVVAAGQDRPSVWTKGDRRHPVSMIKRRADGRSRSGFPQPGCLIPASSEDGTAIRAKGRRVDQLPMNHRPPDRRPVVTFQSRAVWSTLPVKTIWPSGPKGDAQHGAFCGGTPGFWPRRLSHPRAGRCCRRTRSTTVRPSGLNAMAPTFDGVDQRRPDGLARCGCTERDRVVLTRDRDRAAVGAIGDSVDRTRVLATDLERIQARPPSRDVEPERVLEVGIARDRRMLETADEPEHALGHVALLAQGLAVLVGQVGCLLINLPLP